VIRSGTAVSLPAELITDPNTIIALSDAGAHASQLCDACLPTYLLARESQFPNAIVRDPKVFLFFNRNGTGKRAAWYYSVR